MHRYRFHVSPAVMLVAVLALAGYIGAVALSPGAVSAPKALAGQPDRPVSAPSFAFPQALTDNVSRASSSSGQAYSGYRKITDNSEAVVLDAPNEWTDIDTGAWIYQGQQVGVYVAAAGDLARFYSTSSEPGAFMGVSRTLAQTANVEALLDREKPGHQRECKHNGRFDYRDQFYTGRYDLYVSCVKANQNLMVVAATPANHESLILLRIRVIKAADLQAANRIFETFQVLGNPEEDAHHDH